jgi:uncharacterized protein YbdZ (MbtH family)
MNGCVPNQNLQMLTVLAWIHFHWEDMRVSFLHGTQPISLCWLCSSHTRPAHSEEIFLYMPPTYRLSIQYLSDYKPVLNPTLYHVDGSTLHCTPWMVALYTVPRGWQHPTLYHVNGSTLHCINWMAAPYTV